MSRSMSTEGFAGRVVVSLNDECLLNGLAELRWQLRQQLDDGTATVVVDISEVEHLSSTTVAALLFARRHTRARGGKVVLRGPTRRSLEMLTRTGLGRLFVIDTQPAPPAPRRSLR